MADNVGYTPGSGATVAADEIGGVLYQRVKPTHGVDGTAVDVSEANPLPTHDDEAHHLLSFLVQYLESPRGFDKSLGRQRGTVVVESLPTLAAVTTVTTVTTVGTVTNLSTIDTLQGRLQVLGQNTAAWYASVRSRIS